MAYHSLHLYSAACFQMGSEGPQMETNHSSNPEAATKLKPTFFLPPTDTSCSPDKVLVRGQIQQCSFVPSHRFSSFLRSLTWRLVPGWFVLVSFCSSNQNQNDANVDFGTYNSIPPPWYPARSSERPLDRWWASIIMICNWLMRFYIWCNIIYEHFMQIN